ncbi:MAG: shikimate dehydrogenase [Chloroflexi bacterium]|nr:shikimate dehydrogenase [Chloroflexota bacterium]
MNYIGIIGYPLSHSVSPVFQQAALDYHRLDARYVVWETREDRLEDTVRKIRREENWGANVTVPHKERVIPFLDSLDGDAPAVGAVNVIYKRGEKLLGTNTDVYGFLQAVEQVGKFTPGGKRAVVLGAGGAARAVVYALIKSRVAFLAVANRSPLRAESLLGDLGRFAGKGQEVMSVVLQDAVLEPVLRGCDLLVNCTSLGMKGSQQDQMPLIPGLIPKDALVYDLVYNPAETLFLREARKAGARTLGGLPMLVYQGAAAFELWTGKKAPVDIMFEAARSALG